MPKKTKLDDLPELISMGVVQKGSLWHTVTLHSRGNQILKATEGEPNVKSIALEEMKIAFVRVFMNPMATVEGDVKVVER